MKSISLRTTVIASVTALAGVSLVSNIAGYIASANLSKELSYTNDNSLPSLVALGNLESDVNDTRGLLGQHVLAGTPTEARAIDEAYQKQVGDIAADRGVSRPPLR